jgi:putative membrane protein
MIVRPTSNWLRMLFVWDGSVLSAILPQLLVVALLSMSTMATDGCILGRKIPLDTATSPMVGASLAIFLAFRNNASYGRYVEARHIWGDILAACRTLVSQATCTTLDVVPLALRTTALVHALRHELRETDPLPELARYLDADDMAAVGRAAYRPMLILHLIRATLSGLPVERWCMLEQQLCTLSEAIAACERIRNTPIPYPYRVLLHRTVYAYCFLLPFGLVDTIGVATPAISVLLAYTLFALDAIATQVGEPFSCTPNALALDALSRDIERSMMELCGQPLPTALEPSEAFVLT